MTLKKKVLAALIFIFLSTSLLVWLGLSLYTRIADINQSWEDQHSLISHKNQVMFEIHRNFGYGGFIHHFKNLVLRVDEKYNSPAEKGIAATLTAIQSYQSLPLSQLESNALNDFEKIVYTYQQKLTLAKSLINISITAKQLDREVQVDDTLAFAALEQLTQSINHLNQVAEAKATDKLLSVQSFLGEWY